MSNKMLNKLIPMLFTVLLIPFFSQAQVSCKDVLSEAQNQFEPLLSEKLKSLLQQTNAGNGDELVKIEFISDMSYAGDAVPTKIPSFLLTRIARPKLTEKMSVSLNLDKNDPRVPRLEKMFFSKTPITFNGVTASISSHLIIKVRRDLLEPALQSIYSSQEHPALGNPSFMIDLAN